MNTTEMINALGNEFSAEELAKIAEIAARVEQKAKNGRDVLHTSNKEGFAAAPRHETIMENSQNDKISKSKLIELFNSYKFSADSKIINVEYDEQNCGNFFIEFSFDKFLYRVINDRGELFIKEYNKNNKEWDNTDFVCLKFNFNDIKKYLYAAFKFIDNAAVFQDAIKYKEKHFKLSAEQVSEKIIPSTGYCYATDRITVDGMNVGYMYREKPDRETDSGWRFFAGDEDDDYANTPENLEIYDVNTISHYDTDIIPFLNYPIGTAFGRNENGIFEKEEFEIPEDEVSQPAAAAPRHETIAEGKKDIAKFFGNIKDSGWAGFCSETKFTIPYFNKEVEVFLGSEYDEDGEEIDTLPTEIDLIEYEKTFKSFLENIDFVIKNIQENAFEYYKEYYAKAYETEFPCGQYPLDSKIFEKNRKEGEMHEPLNINDKETHFKYMKNLNYIRIVKGNKIVLPIHYKLDVEHKLEILLKNNQVQKIDGMDETYYWEKESSEQYAAAPRPETAENAILAEFQEQLSGFSEEKRQKINAALKNIIRVYINSLSHQTD
jgi:hypothetical protein